MTVSLIISWHWLGQLILRLSHHLMSIVLSSSFCIREILNRLKPFTAWMCVTRCCNKVISTFSFNWWPVIKHNHFHGSKFTIGYYGKFIQTSPLTELQTWSKITIASMHVRYKLLIKRFYFDTYRDTYPTSNIAARWKHSLTLGSVGNWVSHDANQGFVL